MMREYGITIETNFQSTIGDSHMSNANVYANTNNSHFQSTIGDSVAPSLSKSALRVALSIHFV